jgi:hypothetical protein
MTGSVMANGLRNPHRIIGGFFRVQDCHESHRFKLCVSRTTAIRACSTDTIHHHVTLSIPRYFSSALTAVVYDRCAVFTPFTFFQSFHFFPFSFFTCPFHLAAAPFFAASRLAGEPFPALPPREPISAR